MELDVYIEPDVTRNLFHILYNWIELAYWV